MKGQALGQYWPPSKTSSTTCRMYKDAAVVPQTQRHLDSYALCQTLAICKSYNGKPYFWSLTHHLQYALQCLSHACEAEQLKIMATGNTVENHWRTSWDVFWYDFTQPLPFCLDQVLRLRAPEPVEPDELSTDLKFSDVTTTALIP